MGNVQLGMIQVKDANWFTSEIDQHPDGNLIPKPKPLTHDPMEGFPNGRKPRRKLENLDEINPLINDIMIYMVNFICSYVSKYHMCDVLQMLKISK